MILPVSEFVTFATDDTSDILCSFEITMSGSNRPAVKTTHEKKSREFSISDIIYGICSKIVSNLFVETFFFPCNYCRSILPTYQRFVTPVEKHLFTGATSKCSQQNHER